MGVETKIEWCDRSASPWHGCSRVHAGCDNCYAEAMAVRNPKTLGVWGDQGTRVKSKSFVANLRKWNREAEANGIGLIEVGSTPRLMLAPRLRRNVDPSKLLKRLHPEQRDQGAGASGKYWTPFKRLVERLRAELREGPLKDAAGLSCLKDYRSRTDAATRRALTDYLRRGLVPGWGVEEREGRLWVVRRAAE